jgi:hypothetical protein
MGTVWARRREDLLSDCLVPPDVFIPMVDRLAEFVVPYQHVLETEAGQHNVHLYLQGLLSNLPGKNAEDIATFVSRTTGHASIHRDRPLESSPVDQGVGASSDLPIRTSRWHHRLRSEQFPQARHALGRGQTPMVRPPGQSRQLPGWRLHAHVQGVSAIRSLEMALQPGMRGRDR